MVYSAQYGSPYAAYGAIQYGRYAQPQQIYGAWPEKKPKQSGMLYGDWQDSGPAVEPQAVYGQSAAQNAAIIERLRVELQEARDIAYRDNIRKHIAAAHERKNRAAQYARQIDEEETFFILLH